MESSLEMKENERVSVKARSEYKRERAPWNHKEREKASVRERQREAEGRCEK